MKVLAAGKHGCIFDRPLPMMNNESERMPKVHVKLPKLLGKLFNADAGFEKEWELAKRIAVLDKKQEYFVYAIEKGTCNVDELKKHGSECAFLQNPKKAVYGQLIIPDGGVSLEAYISDRKKQLSYADGLRLLMPCFKGIQRLTRASWLHQDLHPGNIVVDDNGRARIIDFGLMVNSDDAFDKKKNPYSRSPYYLHPPEYRMDKPWSGEKTLYERRASCDPNVSLWNVMEAAHMLDLNEMYYKAFANYMKASKKAGEDAKIARVLRKHAPRVDVYTMGVVMAWMAPAIVDADKEKWYALMVELLCADPRRRTSVTLALQYIQRVIA